MFYLIDPDNTFNYICVTILTEMTLSGDFVTKIRTFPRPNEADKGVYNYFFDGEKYGVEEPASGEGRRYAGPFTLRTQSVLIGNSLTTLFGFESAAPSGGELMYLNNPVSNIGTENPYLAVVYHKDHLGSTRAITKVDGTILEQNDYYPFGLRTTRGENYSTLSQSLAVIAQNANNTTANTVVPEYLYNGKEKQNFIKNTSAVINAGGSTDYTSNYLDYGARFYNPTTIRWNTQDPLAEKYYRYSPYVYCVNNPISLVDPNGEYILNESKEEWERNKKDVQQLHYELSTKILSIIDKAIKNGWDSDKLGSKLGDITDRLSSVSETLKTIETLENSAQGYALRTLSINADGSVNNGGLTFNNDTKVITINYYGTANFVHEITHADQFETGDIAFNRQTGESVAGDYQDEMKAYYRQYYYDPTSLRKHGVWKTTDINRKWLSQYDEYKDLYPTTVKVPRPLIITSEGGIYFKYNYNPNIYSKYDIKK